MKKHLLLVAWALIFAQSFPGYAMGERQAPPDPACLVSEELRLQLGGHIFSVPRKDLNGFRCIEAAFADKCTVESNKICQRIKDAPFVVSDMSVYMGGDEFSSRCEGPHLVITLFDTNNGLAPKNASSPSAQAMTEECAINKYYQNYCRYKFQYQNLRVQLQYDIHCHPPEKAADTLALVIKTIKKYETPAH